LPGIRKLVLLLIATTIVPTRMSLGQSTPTRAGPVESSAAAAKIDPRCPCPAESCDEEPQSGWLCSRPLCALFNRLKADSKPVPWANWSEHPLSIGCFAGMVNGGALIEDWTGTTTGFDGGWRLGWDVSPSWGGEMRFAFGSLQLYDSFRADQALTAHDNANGLLPNDPQRGRFDHRNADLFQWDVDIVYYPWGETRLRPYFLTGMGLTNIHFTDRLDEGYHSTCLSLPLGLGVKYLCNERLALRLDLLDDIAMSSNHLRTQHNLSLTAGAELRFGGSRKVYWPWDLGRSFW